MIECEYLLKEGICGLATDQAGVKTPANEHACQFCLNCNKPKSLNKAVASIAVAALMKLGKFDTRNPKHAAMQDILTVEEKGPGTELKKLISWFPVPNKNGCRSCRNLEVKMNNWGSEKCHQKIDYIIKKLEIAARRRSVPFVRFAVVCLVETAISRGSLK